MKFLFNKIICLFILFISVSCSVQTELEKAVYKVKIPHSNGKGIFQATGFFISEDLFVTAFHVVHGNKDIHHISLHSGRRVLFSPIKIKSLEYISLYADLAILRTETKSPYFLRQGETSLEEPLTLLGYPEGQFRRLKFEEFKTSFRESYSPNYSIIEYPDPDKRKLELSGASGSPLLNSKGEYVGVLSKSGGRDISFAPYKLIDKLFKGEVGQKCLDFSCINQEYEMVRNHIETYAHNTEEIPLDKETFFHLPSDFISSISDRDTVLSYLAKGFKQDKTLLEPLKQNLLYLKHIKATDSDTYKKNLEILSTSGCFEIFI